MRRGGRGETRTASALAAREAAMSSRRFHVRSRFALNSASLASSSWNFFEHSSNSSGSWSEKILRTFRVKLWTAWFQWFLVFRSNVGNIIGSITDWFCFIKFSM